MVLDARPALGRRTGVGIYVDRLLAAMARLDTPLDLIAFTSSWRQRRSLANGSSAGSASDGVRVEQRHFRVPVRALNRLWQQRRWPPVEWFAGTADVAHSPHPLLLPARRARQIVTVHDLYFLLHPEHTVAEIRRDYADRIAGSVRRADLVLFDSRATAELATELLGVESDRSAVVPLGVDQCWFEEPDGAAPPLPERPFALWVGTIEPRKNPLGALRAFARGAPELDLVMAGTPATPLMARQVDAAVGELGLGGRVHRLGHVGTDHLRWLYRRAELLLFASLHEGFGLPILEAFASGCPVITSDRTSMPEVAGNAAELVDPTDDESVAAAILRVVESSELRARLIARGRERARRFPWRRTAEATVELYLSLSGRSAGGATR